MFLARIAAMMICAAFPLLAAPRLTTIQDSIYKADGTRFNGTAVISWTPFDTSDSTKIGLQSLTVQITNGAFRIQLVPNADATPANYYTVQYSSDGKQQFTESWSVPSSTTTLRIKDVRVVASSSTGSSGGGVVQPPSQTPINESSVTGLLTDLSIRPIRGSGYTAGRVAVVNDSGAIDSATGDFSDCVRVDGSTGPCFDSNYLPGYADYETPGGVVDGSNASFTLANAPDPASSLTIYLNGLVLQAGSDYSIQSDGSILFVAGAVPQPGDVLRACYRMGTSSAASIVVAPQTVQPSRVQVLCSGSGTGTSNGGNPVLGICTIPANTLAIGDRVEVRFNLAHQGTSSGFTYQVNWGHTTMVQRVGSSRDALVTGHGDASVGPSGTTLDMQTWGTVLTLDSRVAASADAINADIEVDFMGGISSKGTDVVSLQNYTILRYPAQ